MGRQRGKWRQGETFCRPAAVTDPAHPLYGVAVRTSPTPAQPKTGPLQPAPHRSSVLLWSHPVPHHQPPPPACPATAAQLSVPSAAEIVFPTSINHPSNIYHGQPARGSGSTHCGGHPGQERQHGATQASSGGGTAASPQLPAAPPPPAVWVTPPTARPTMGGSVDCGTFEASPLPCPHAASWHQAVEFDIAANSSPGLFSLGGVVHRPPAHEGVPTLVTPHVTPPHDGSNGGGLGMALQVVAGAGAR